SPRTGPCPAVSRRLDGVHEWTCLVRSGWTPALTAEADDPVLPWAQRAWQLLPLRIEAVPEKLAPWVKLPVSLQPCLCDPWHDHILFEGDTLTGLIDYGSVKVDHVAVDLARLLGSLVGDHAEQRAVGLLAYALLRPLTAEEEALVHVL